MAGGLLLALVLMRVTSRKSTAVLPRADSSERDRRLGARTNWQRRTRPGMQRTRSSDLYAY